jgi:hypothetical protein
MAHAKKPNFVFRRNGRVHLNRRGRQFSRLLEAEVCASAVVMLEYTMFRGSVKSIGYPLHSPVSPSLPLPCVTVCHHISTGLYKKHITTVTFKQYVSENSPGAEREERLVRVITAVSLKVQVFWDVYVLSTGWILEAVEFRRVGDPSYSETWSWRH